MTDRIAAYYAAGGGQGHSVKAYKGQMMLSNGVTPLTEGFKKWQRFNADEELIYVDDLEGRPRALTPKQYAVLRAVQDIIGNGRGVTMRSMAQSLEVAPSTVSRAMTKLQAWGLIVYHVGRGRFAGLLVIKRVKGDGMDRFRKAAQARVKRWSEAAQRRISRLEINVAPYFLEERRGVDSLYHWFLGTSTYKSATLTAQLSRPWTSEELGGIE